MIKKSIIFTIFLLICWNFLIQYKPFSLSQHQWQDNIISAEKFIYDIDSIDNLIVGSSLARKLQMDSLPNFYNLSLGGQSIFDGLNILRNKKNLPRNVFIETNVFVRGENSNFNEIVSSSILNKLKESSSIFRTDKQPLAYVGKRVVSPIVSGFFYKIIYMVRDKIKLEFQPKETINPSESGNTIFDKMLALQLDNYSKDIDTSMMNNRFESLKNHIEFLESKGVKVFFFEMPVNPALLELNRSKYLRHRVKSEFQNNYFISLPDNIEIYKTGDGIHLTSEESKIYTEYFKNEVITVANNVYKK
jgi:hypothetical protein